MESLARAERLRELQARNAERAAVAGHDYQSLLAEIRQAYKSGRALSLPGPVPVPVVFDVNVLVLAIAAGESPFRSCPSPPDLRQPQCGLPGRDQRCGRVRAPGCPRHILASSGRVLAAMLKTPDEEVDEYLQVLAEMADASGGGITDPPQTVGDCPDWEDNRILDLAAAVGAFLVVSADADWASMWPWRGRPVIEPPQFASLIDAFLAGTSATSMEGVACDRFSARRGTYRVIYRIDDKARMVTGVDVAHRRGVYRT